MRWRGRCDNSFESYEKTNSKNMNEKTRQPLGGTLEHLKIFHKNGDLINSRTSSTSQESLFTSKKATLRCVTFQV